MLALALALFFTLIPFGKVLEISLPAMS